MLESPQQNQVSPILGEKKKITAQGWFSKGERVVYDYQHKRIQRNGASSDANINLNVFRRQTARDNDRDGVLEVTFLGGFPDGSFGWARVDSFLPDEDQLPRLFVEYIGQGDSDKPTNYPHSILERADLVEAQWRDLDLQSTFIAAFDFSAIVVLELLSRQQDRICKGEPPVTDIKGVLLINGGLFADGHTHPWFTTPLLTTPFGKIGTWIAQRSRFVFGELVSSLWSKEYNVSREEIDEVYDAVSRRNGVQFLSNGAKFVSEHKRNAKRWNLKRLFHDMKSHVSFHVVGSEGDVFEWNQITKAKKRLGKAGLDIRTMAGGHLSTSEHPDKLAEIIVELVGGESESVVRRAS